MNRRHLLLGVVGAIVAIGLAIAIVGAVDTGAPTPETPPSPSAPRANAHPPSATAPRPRPRRPAAAPPSPEPKPGPAAAPSADAVGPPPDDPAEDPLAEEAAPAHDVSVWPLSREGIQGAVQEALPGMKACYDDALARDPALAGQMTLGFTVVDQDGIGKVTVVEFDDGAVTDDGMIDCVLDSFEELQFDPPEGGGELSVSYPIAFSLEEPEDG